MTISASFRCDEDYLTSDMSIVNRIWYDLTLFDAGLLSVELIDGSKFKRIKSNRYSYSSPDQKLTMKFMTITGVQTVQVVDDDSSLNIQSATITEINTLKANLNQALSSNLNSIVNTLGEELFSRFFNPRQFQS